jgi:uncharacterized protein DUF6011
MITWRKLGADVWGIQSDTALEPGQSVSVTSRAGKTSAVTVGERQNMLGFVYAISRQSPQAQTIGDLSGILALFDKAAQHLKHPAIVLAVRSLPGSDLPYDWSMVRLHVAGERAKFPGSITVLDGERDDVGERAWLGRITRDGIYQPARAANGRTESITKRLREFAATPALIAKDSARLTGRCCFCNTALKDERSTAVGYGETCASHYGLPWGAK